LALRGMDKIDWETLGPATCRPFFLSAMISNTYFCCSFSVSLSGRIAALQKDVSPASMVHDGGVGPFANAFQAIAVNGREQGHS
jgi:hypothetical protein